MISVYKAEHATIPTSLFQLLDVQPQLSCNKRGLDCRHIDSLAVKEGVFDTRASFKRAKVLITLPRISIAVEQN